MSVNPSICFCLVSHSGPLEGMSALLAASLHKNLPFGATIVVGVPAACGGIPDRLSDFFSRMSAETFDIENPIGEDYKIGNKLGCLEAVAKVHSDKRIVFLDTDIVCLPSRFEPDDLGTEDLALRVAGFPWRPHDWERAYGSVGLEPPTRVIESANSREPMPPYYNAGVISVAPGSPFPATWIDVCRRLYHDPRLVNKFPWLDQIAIPVAAAALNLEIQELDRRFNSVPHQVAGDCVFLHYHNRAKRLKEHRGCRLQVKQLVAEIPEVLDFYPQLAKIVKRWWER